MTATPQDVSTMVPPSPLKVLADNREERKRLHEAVEASQKELLTKSLDVLKLALPHAENDGTVNSLQFKALKHRLLDEDGRIKRSLDKKIDCFFAVQLMEITEVRTEIKGSGEFNLPPGVRMPAKKN